MSLLFTIISTPTQQCARSNRWHVPRYRWRQSVIQICLHTCMHVLSLQNGLESLLLLFRASSGILSSRYFTINADARASNSHDQPLACFSRLRPVLDHSRLYVGLLQESPGSHARRRIMLIHLILQTPPPSE